MTAYTPPDKQAIIEAHKRIEPYVERTPILTSASIENLVGAKIFFKCENLQKIGAFKARGATNAALLLSDEDRKKGLATHSSGNHGQAVARAAKILGTKAYVVMPRTTAEIKKKGVAVYGGEIVFCEPTIQSREQTLKEVVSRTGASVIHPYNNYDVIAGQATAAKELIEDLPSIDILMAPVGGGGLLSGTLLAAEYFSSGILVIGAEPAGADDAFRSMKSGKIEPSQANSIADGLLSSLGDKTFDILFNKVQSILTVTDAQIVSAMRLIWERMKIIVEPSAAVPLAAVLNNASIFAGKKIGIVLSGGNVDIDRASKLFAEQA